MVLHGRLGADAFILSLKPASFVVSADDRYVVAWDRAGRLYSIVRDDRTYRRGLNGRTLEKWQDARGRHKRWPSGAEADALVDEAAALPRRVSEAIRHHTWRWTEPPGADSLDELLGALDLAARFDSHAAARDRAHFARVYRPIGILPPDQYLSLVLQATEGCSFGSCTFCALYDGPYRVKEVGEFTRHISEVRDYLGASLKLRSRSIFLGAANALAVPMSRLVPLFEVMARELDAPRLGVYAFVDAFTGTHKQAADYEVLARLGLRRVYIGLESGHDPLLEFVKKPGLSADAVETVRAVKAAGVMVGVIVMIGLGGDRFETGHIADTAAALNTMELGAGDLVYFSDLVEVPGTVYPVLAADRSIRPLTSTEREAQRQSIRRKLSFPGEPPQIATYDVLEFVY
jgi:hypothetical protein